MECMKMMVVTYCTCVLVGAVSLLVAPCLTSESPHCGSTSWLQNHTVIPGFVLAKSPPDPKGYLHF